MSAPVSDVAKEPTAYVLSAELRVALLTYLAQRPYHEVAQGVQALQALQPVASE